MTVEGPEQKEVLEGNMQKSFASFLSLKDRKFYFYSIKVIVFKKEVPTTTANRKVPVDSFSCIATLHYVHCDKCHMEMHAHIYWIKDAPFYSALM